MNERAEENSVMSKEQLVLELQMKLDWYTDEATEEEFDAKAVESILYLLDTLQPVDEEVFPNEEIAWRCFEKMIVERNTSGAEGCEPDEQKERNCGGRRIIWLLWKRKEIVVAVILILILAIGGTMQAEALKNSGFFHWLRTDKKGSQMITSPETLESATSEVKCYYEKKDMPEETRTWVELVEGIGGLRDFVWEKTEEEEHNNLHMMEMMFVNETSRETVNVGVIKYANIVSLNTSVYVDYSYSYSFWSEDGNIEFMLCNRTEPQGEIFYHISFLYDTRFYYVTGLDADALKEIAIQYAQKIKK